jgi:hypothetical protein
MMAVEGAVVGEEVEVDPQEVEEDKEMVLPRKTRATSNVSNATRMDIMQINVQVPRRRRRMKLIMLEQSLRQQCYLQKQQSWDCRKICCRKIVRRLCC